MKQSFTAIFIYAAFLVFLQLIISCSISRNGIFEKKTPHEAYTKKIEAAGLQSSALGIAWLTAAQKALVQPISVHVPYSETIYFAAEQPSSAGYIFYIRRGEQVKVNIITNNNASIRLFADLWKYGTEQQPDALMAADTINNSITYEAEKDDSLLLRIQPELLGSGSFTITITTAPTLAFPVPSKERPTTGSFWGDSRDAGARKHEGIDIFGKFRTPVVAAADGFITRVGENDLGGKIIFLRPSGKNYNLYYAHLDSQIAEEGTTVKTGDIIGLMGNTGNAKNTPTHLHFGIYTNTGAVDPLPFVKMANEKAANITASLQLLNNYMRSKAAANIYTSPNSKTVIEKIKAGTALQVIGATGNLYRVELPGQQQGFTSSNNLAEANNPVKTIKAQSSIILLDDASTIASEKLLITEKSSINIYGSYKNYYFIRSGTLNGWIKMQ